MDLTELRRRLGRPGFPPAAPPEGRGMADSDLLARLEAVRRRGQTAPMRREPALVDRLGGFELAPGVVEVVRRHALALRHGRVPLARLAEIDGDRGGLLRWRGRLDPERLVFLDTETTGLAGGAGTVAFLIGVARLAAGTLQTRQWLLTAFSGEAALLDRLAVELGRDDVLVSFNGKSFDAPLINTRGRLLGRGEMLRGRAHIDLLHALRRGHARSLPDCRLKTAEGRLLGLDRGHDLPGDQAPAAWRDWLRDGYGARLNEVLAHNRADLLSTAALLAVLAGEGMPGPIFAAPS
jgi:hypothetical protein